MLRGAHALRRDPGAARSCASPPGGRWATGSVRRSRAASARPNTGTRLRARVDAAIEELRAGKMIILVDDEDRENEGDLVHGRREGHARGDQLHGQARPRPDLPDADRGAALRALDLPLMVARGTTAPPFGTAFTVSIEARDGVTTGISRRRPRAHDPRRDRPGRRARRPRHARATSSRCARKPRRRAACAPARPRASVDLARLAGLDPAGVICEIMNDDGTMARMPDLERFAARARPQDRHDRRPDRVPAAHARTLVERVAEATLPTQLRRVPARSSSSTRSTTIDHVALVTRRGPARASRRWCACTASA